MDQTPERATNATDRIDDAIRIAGPVAKSVAGQMRPGETVRLVPPKDLAQGLKDGSLELLRIRAGDSAIVIDSNTGTFAGHMVVKRDGRRARAKARPQLSPAVAWQVAAVATQQHYLAEINAKLESISQGVRELQDRMQHDQLGELLSMRAGLEDMRRRRARGVLASVEDRLRLRKWMQEAESVRYTAILNTSKAFDTIAGRDLAPTTPAALLVRCTEDGSIDVQLEQ